MTQPSRRESDSNKHDDLTESNQYSLRQQVTQKRKMQDKKMRKTNHSRFNKSLNSLESMTGSQR